MNNEKLDDMRNKVLNAKEALKQYIYYILISILSLLSIRLCFLIKVNKSKRPLYAVAIAPLVEVALVGVIV